MRRGAAHSFTLPRAVLARLVHFCAVADERPVDVIADAVALHLDELEGFDELRAAELAPGTPPGPAPAPIEGAPPPEPTIDLPAFLRRWSS